MPELPEVETVARGLNKQLTGDVVESVWIGSKKQPLKSSARLLARTLEGKRIARVHRAGKHIVFDLEGSAEALPSNGKRRANGNPKRRLASQVDPEAQWIVGQQREASPAKRRAERC